MKYVAKNLGDFKDVANKPYFKEGIEIARSRGKEWRKYKFSNPRTKKIEDKIVNLRKYKDIILT